MKGVVFTGERKLEIREFPDPTPGPGEVVLEIKASGMCGSDLKFYWGAGGASSLGLWEGRTEYRRSRTLRWWWRSVPGYPRSRPGSACASCSIITVAAASSEHCSTGWMRSASMASRKCMA